MPTAVERKDQSGVLTINGGGREIPILSFNLQVVAPRDAQTGQASGKRQHQPVVITKQWDSSSPKLFQCVATNETLSEVTIEFVDNWLTFKNAKFTDVVRKAGNVEDFTLEFEDADTGTGAAGRPVRDDWELTEIALTFQKIRVSYAGGGKTASDDWTL
jgi:type VI secretion system secreted protein Hcp